MKTLTAFWHWVDNEKPEKLDADSFRHLSDVADQALDIASDVVGERVGRPHVTVDQLREHWPAVRDLSLLICSGLERMHESVPEGAARPSEVPPAIGPICPECGSGFGHNAGCGAVRGYPSPEMYGTGRAACPACCCVPCQGSSLDCDVDRYVAEHGTMGLQPKLKPPTLAEWATHVDDAKIHNLPPGRVLGRLNHPDSCGCSLCHQQRAGVITREDFERAALLPNVSQVRLVQRAVLTGDVSQQAGGTRERPVAVLDLVSEFVETRCAAGAWPGWHFKGAGAVVINGAIDLLFANARLLESAKVTVYAFGGSIEDRLRRVDHAVTRVLLAKPE